MFEFIETKLRGCLLIKSRKFSDSRGEFLKVFAKSEFRKNGIDFDFSEQFFSVSKKGVLRGLHFQIPPHDHAKIVYCVSGQVLDVVVDLRKSSATYGQHITIELAENMSDILYIPTGMAHGFYSQADKSIMIYNVSTQHDPTHDRGIRWDSCNIRWPGVTPVLSERDQSFPSMADFDSPF